MKTWTTIILLAMSAGAYAQQGGAATGGDDAINPDRPDLPQSSFPVGKGVFQLETGYLFERDSQDGVLTRTGTTPTSLRYGVSDSLEIRLDTLGYIHQRTTDVDGTDTEDGAADIQLGFKKHFHGTPETGSTGMLFEVNVPSGSSEFRSNLLNPVLTLAGDKAMGRNQFSGNVLASYEDLGEGKTTVLGYAGSVTRPITPQVSGFVDFGGQHPLSHGGPQLLAGFGLEFPSKVQAFDAAAHFGLNASSPTYQVTAGYARKF